MKEILCNGKIYVERGHFEQALYIEDGVIRAVGSNSAVRAAAGSGAKETDCAGRTVIPGLNDSHMHLLNIGVTLSQAKLNGAKSIDEIIEITRRFMKEHPEYCRKGVQGRGWNQDYFTDGKRLPNRHDLDKISTEVPVVLTRVCGHIAVANTKAIEMLGLGRNSPQYEGGKFGVEADGYPDGVFAESARFKIKSVIPEPTQDEYEKMFLEAMDYAASKGITSVQSNDVGTFGRDYARDIRMLNSVYGSGKAKLRYHPQMRFITPEDFRDYLDGKYGRLSSAPLLERASLKLFKDGSLGARTALMCHEYLDDPGNTGVDVTPSDVMEQYCALADKAGMQVVTHVIGDRAAEEVVQVYEKFIKNGTNPNRHGLIHFQISSRPLVERVVKDHIVVFYQPIFLDYDMHILLSRCGEELSSTSYAFRTVEDLGGHVGYGTDSPVEDCNPFPNLYSAVTRKDKNGWPEGGFFPQECVDVYRAVDAYTSGSAYMEFRENSKGRLKPGFAADLTVLDTDIFSCDPMEIRNIRPVLTMTAGNITYSA